MSEECDSAAALFLKERSGTMDSKDTSASEATDAD